MPKEGQEGAVTQSKRSKNSSCRYYILVLVLVVLVCMVHTSSSTTYNSTKNSLGREQKISLVQNV